jgi:hypothetical protein
MSRLQSPILFFAVLLLSLAGIATPGTALAQAQIGIYFDTDYTQTTLGISDFPTQVTGYLVLHNPEGGYPVHGWECCVDVSGPITFLGWELEGLTINVLDPPCFTVGIGGDPLPGTEDVLLATFQGLVTQGMPVLFNLEPVYYASIPDEMVYLGGEDGHTLLPMVTPTGLPQVASINEDLPFPELSADELVFGERPIGTTTIRNLVVSNIGGGMLYLDVTLPPEVTDYTIVNNAGEVWIPVGESRTITVYFEPSAVGPINTVLHLGPVAPDVPLYGSGREPIVTYTGPDSVDFGDSALGTTVTRTASFINTGEIPIIVAPSLQAGCEGFTVLNPDPFELLVGLTTTVHLSFTSPYPGDFECTLDMGDVIAPLTLTAQAHEAVVAYTVTPDTLTFGPLAEGSSQQLPLLIENTGEAGFSVDPQVVDPLGNFQIAGIVGDTQVQPGSTLIIMMLFEPQGTGLFTGELQLGDVVSPVYLEGQAEAANPQCEVTPTLLEYPTISVGSAAQSYFTVQNTGNVPLTVTPYEDCDHFYVAPFPVNLPPEASAQFMVLFNPQAAGEFTCTISLGGSSCEPVVCTGSAELGPPPTDEDIVGIFFDSGSYLMNDGYLPTPGIITGYLVLKNCSIPQGVSAWELRHELVGPAFFAGSTLMGQALNIGNAPDFIVGLGEPLPPTPDVLLAEFNYFIYDPYMEIYLTLGPASIPSLPGSMVFASGADSGVLLPMFPFTGFAEVAFINRNPLDVQRPEQPTVTAQGQQVALSWDLPESPCEGFHVYRRSGMEEPQRLTDQPESVMGSQVTYLDTPTDFASGSVLHYSYSLVQDGSEGPRSPEVEYTVQNLPAAVTRLLTNVPNPFNPQTRIRFELSKPGSVQVAIFDVSGRLVRTLASESLAAGPHERVWQGKDNAGRQVPSGAYYVRLVTATGTDHRKIMLLK